MEQSNSYPNGCRTQSYCCTASLHSLSDDVATVKRAIEHIGEPVLLVGHSYGGEVITNAGYNNPNVAAFAPDKGEGEFSFINPAKFPKGLLIKDSGGFIYLNPELFRENFAQDVTPAEAEIMAIAQKPFNQSEITAKSVRKANECYYYFNSCQPFVVCITSS
ncbi:MAG: alpha/beta hydrolase [Nitrososphaeraceae archaeon]